VRLGLVEVLAHPDKALEVSGALVGGTEMGDSGLLQMRESQITQSLELRFRALLRGGASAVELALLA
jgi:hypothetical protein